MLTRIVRPSPALEAFLQPLAASLTQPQRQHLLELADALLVCEDRKTLAALQRQFLDTTDPSNWADFLRLSPWSAGLVRDSLPRRPEGGVGQRGHRAGAATLLASPRLRHDRDVDSRLSGGGALNPLWAPHVRRAPWGAQDEAGEPVIC